mmetsp:Transcript_2841/g.8935  ORF Transcript_2841/g.8935 Transcript_2841/m.8935 type:complete len:568 (-) Transcript_2841:332-2035(-)
MRDHLPTMAMALYYPRRVTPDMGPTHIMPFSQYGSVDAEHAHCGEDRLGAGRFEEGVGFSYASSDAASRRRCLEEDTLELFPAATRSADQRRGLSLTVEAGTVAIIHYDLLHRGSAVAGPEAFAADTLAAVAADADAAAPAPPWRPMFKFQFVRVLEPLSPSSAVPPSSSAPSSASLSWRPPRVKGRRLRSNSSGRRMLLRRPQGSARDGWRAVLRPEEAPFGAAEEEDLSLLWDHVLQYLRGGKGGRGGASSQATAATAETARLAQLRQRLLAPNRQRGATAPCTALRGDEGAGPDSDYSLPATLAAQRSGRGGPPVEPSESSRLGAAYALGRLARGRTGDPGPAAATAGAALDALLGVLACNGSRREAEAARRAAMRGLAAAGGAAVPRIADALTASLDAAARPPEVSRGDSSVAAGDPLAATRCEGEVLRYLAHALGGAMRAADAADSGAALAPKQVVSAVDALSRLVASAPPPGDHFDVARSAAAEAIGPALQRFAATSETCGAVEVLLAALDDKGVSLPHGGTPLWPLHASALLALQQVIIGREIRVILEMQSALPLRHPAR